MGDQLLPKDSSNSTCALTWVRQIRESFKQSVKPQTLIRYQ